MDSLPDYYGQSYPSLDQRGSMDEYSQDGNMADPGAGSMDSNMMGGFQTLDQIISHNNQEMMRRRTTYQPQYQPSGLANAHLRRQSMMEFGSNMNHDLAEFQFDPNPAHSAVQVSNQITTGGAQQKSPDLRKVRSREDLALDTRFSQLHPAFPADALSNSVTTYSPGLMSGAAPGMDPSAAYLPQQMDLSMEFDNLSGDVTPMNGGSIAQPVFSESPLAQNFPMPYPPSNHDPGGGGVGGGGQPSPRTPMQSLKLPPGTLANLANFPPKQQHFRRQLVGPSPLTAAQPTASDNLPSPATVPSPLKPRRVSTGEAPAPFADQNNALVDQLSQDLTESQITKYPSAYSSSGFDMLGVLMRVAARKNPEINIGPVDLSCAFVVCDIDKHDIPIVYCSDVFERLTGYTRFEILGRNCRFLQSPDGRVQPGVKRKYVDDRSVLYLKNQISKRAEAQLSLINYRKGGQPFMNLLTMIPIPWDGEEYKYYVGFQVDLVEQPQSISSKNPDGTHLINYQRGQLPSYVLQPPEINSALQADIGQTIGRDEVSNVLANIGSGETEHVKRIWDKVLLENTDDVVHVLSLKGLFLYLSPACRKVLEYDASELVGTPLSSVCHPSDIVPVTRELKDTSSGTAVNVVFRIRRKHSGYTWFESHGCLHTEQGKGRKCIILVGRQRPVYALNKNDITNDGAISDSELWSKMSTAGMFLYMSSNVRPTLDRLPEDLVGTSMQALMRPESRKELGRALEMARTGEKATFKHDLQNRRGQVLQAQTTIYPGDSQKGSKPTFLLAQTRLLKLTRAMMLNPRLSAASPRTDQASIGSVTPSTYLSDQSAISRPASTALSSQSANQENLAMTSAGGAGLPLGNQDEALASEDNIFSELKTTRSSSWQFELRQMERQNRLLAEELAGLMSRKKKRKRRKGLGQMEKDCANCHTRNTPEWRRGPSGQRDLCNSCGLRWAKQNGKVSPRKSLASEKADSTSPKTKQASHADGDDRTPVKGGVHTPASSATARLDGPPPPKIEEGPEPSHTSVRPA